MKKYIVSLVISVLVAKGFHWILSFTTFTDMTIGILVGSLGMFTIITCLECYRYGAEDDDDDDIDVGGDAMPYPQH